jgi:hypothetical protein
MPESHSCTFDYKTPGRAALEVANPKIDLIKVEKI